MLPDWMIAEIKKQEEERARQERERSQLEIPLPPEDWRPYPEEKEEKSERGVIIFDIWGDE